MMAKRFIVQLYPTALESADSLAERHESRLVEDRIWQHVALDDHQVEEALVGLAPLDLRARALERRVRLLDVADREMAERPGARADDALAAEPLEPGEEPRRVGGAADAGVRMRDARRRRSVHRLAGERFRERELAGRLVRLAEEPEHEAEPDVADGDLGIEGRAAAERGRAVLRVARVGVRNAEVAMRARVVGRKRDAPLAHRDRLRVPPAEGVEPAEREQHRP